MQVDKAFNAMTPEELDKLIDERHKDAFKSFDDRLVILKDQIAELNTLYARFSVVDPMALLDPRFTALRDKQSDMCMHLQEAKIRMFEVLAHVSAARENFTGAASLAKTITMESHKEAQAMASKVDEVFKPRPGSN